MNQCSTAESYFEQLQRVIAEVPVQTIERIAAEILIAYEENRTVFIFGNGGSAALATHFACDLTKGTVVAGERHKRMRVSALTDNVPMITAWANDTSYENIFAGQLRDLIQPGDVAFAISGSGNSPNVLRALEVARDAGALNVGLTGYQGGALRMLCDLCIVIPSDNMQIIEDLHLSVAHAIFSVIRNRLNDAKIQRSKPEPVLPD